MRLPLPIGPVSFAVPAVRIARQRVRRLALSTACMAAVWTIPGRAQTPAPSRSPESVAGEAQGIIEGRVLNGSSGNYLNSARVSIPGTSIETSTDATGFYRLTNVPAGEVRVMVSYVGLNTESATVNVSGAGAKTQQIKRFHQTDFFIPGSCIISA